MRQMKNRNADHQQSGGSKELGLPGFLMYWHKNCRLHCDANRFASILSRRAAEAANPSAPTADGCTSPPDALRNSRAWPRAPARFPAQGPVRAAPRPCAGAPAHARERSRTEASARRCWDKISLTVSILEWDALSPARSKHLFCFAIARAMTWGHDICNSWIGI